MMKLKGSARSATLGLVIAGGLTIAPATMGAAAQGGGVLAGEWSSTDTDGSQQSLAINGSGQHVYAMHYTDDVATGACGGAPANLSGPGFVSDDAVTMVAALVCRPGGNPFHQTLMISFVHDAASDTLTDDFGVVWTRVTG